MPRAGMLTTGPRCAPLAAPHRVVAAGKTRERPSVLCCCAVLRCAALRCAVPCCALLLCSAALCYALLYCVSARPADTPE
jgi:hypothetical protein